MNELNLTEDAEKEEVLCFIHEKVDAGEVEEIRRNLCRHSVAEEHDDDNFYCIFHSPSYLKDHAEFEKKFKERLKAYEQAAAGAENLPEEEKKEFFYDFRCVYFPGEVDFGGYEFKAAADFKRTYFKYGANFSAAVFSSEANFEFAAFEFWAQFFSATFKGFTNFRYAEFLSAAYFKRSIFVSKAAFDSATFEEQAFFGECGYLAEAEFKDVKFKSNAEFYASVFMEGATFSEAKFKGTAYLTNIVFVRSASFVKAKFYSEAYFNYTKFLKYADFQSTKFGKKSKVEFDQTEFCQTVNFGEADVAGTVKFIHDVFLNNESVINEVKPDVRETFKRFEKELRKRGIETELPPPEIKDDQEGVLLMRGIRLREPEYFIFTETTLRPNWFIKADKIKFIKFDEVTWLETDIDNDPDAIEKELERLRSYYVTEPEKYLRIVFYQLADNADLNYSFKKAKHFRRLGEMIDEE